MGRATEVCAPGSLEGAMGLETWCQQDLCRSALLKACCCLPLPLPDADANCRCPAHPPTQPAHTNTPHLTSMSRGNLPASSTASAASVRQRLTRPPMKPNPLPP